MVRSRRIMASRWGPADIGRAVLFVHVFGDLHVSAEKFEQPMELPWLSGPLRRLYRAGAGSFRRSLVAGRRSDVDLCAVQVTSNLERSVAMLTPNAAPHHPRVWWPTFTELLAHSPRRSRDGSNLEGQPDPHCPVQAVHLEPQWLPSRPRTTGNALGGSLVPGRTLIKVCRYQPFFDR
jgi:hypothetical protein